MTEVLDRTLDWYHTHAHMPYRRHTPHINARTRSEAPTRMLAVCSVNSPELELKPG